MAYEDPRLVSLYDADNPDGEDHDFFRALADEVGARTVVDLGCGTGLLTVTLARTGRQVIGIDPSPVMLDVARQRPGGDAVRWVHGDSADVRDAGADLVVMSGNVAQHLTGEAWTSALRDVAGGLSPGGHLAFERRNPGARAWEEWDTTVHHRVRDTPVGRLEEWERLADVRPEAGTANDGGQPEDVEVTLECHTVFTAAGEHVVEELVLSFRSPSTVGSDLEAAGFDVLDVRGGWRSQSLAPTSPLMVVRARRR